MKRCLAIEIFMGLILEIWNVCRGTLKNIDNSNLSKVSNWSGLRNLKLGRVIKSGFKFFFFQPERWHCSSNNHSSVDIYQIFSNLRRLVCVRLSVKTTNRVKFLEKELYSSYELSKYHGESAPSVSMVQE